MKPTPRLTRRQMAKLLGIFAALPAAFRPTRSLWARPEGAGPSPEPAPGAVPARQEPEAAPPGAQGLLDYVKAQFGHRLTADELKEIDGQIRRRLQRTALREYKVANHDEPAFLFRVYRATD